VWVELVDLVEMVEMVEMVDLVERDRHRQDHVMQDFQ
jgi:hypothetical protein